MQRGTDSRRTTRAFALGMAWAIHSTVAFAIEGYEATQDEALVPGFELAQGNAPTASNALTGDIALANKQSSSSIGLRGFVQAELARTIAGPAHWSNMHADADGARHARPFR